MGKNKKARVSIHKPVEEVDSFEQAGESKFARALGSSDFHTRERGLQALTNWLTTNKSVDALSLDKIWKGILFCFWHSDKQPVQQDLANRLAGIMLKCHVHVRSASPPHPGMAVCRCASCACEPACSAHVLVITSLQPGYSSRLASSALQPFCCVPDVWIAPENRRDASHCGVAQRCASPTSEHCVSPVTEHCMLSQVGAQYFSGFLRTMTQNWNRIDRLRMDKFMMLARVFFHAAFTLLDQHSWCAD
jgi:Nucleolar protein,Nop52